MKKALLHIMVLCALATVTYSHAHWWRVNNFTTKTLLLKLKLFGSNNPYYAIATPDSSALFDWSVPNPMAGFCFDKLYWVQAPEQLLQDKTLVDDHLTVINNKKMDIDLKQKYQDLKLNDANIQFLKNKFYEKTVKFASALGPKKLIKWIAEKYAKSACKSRHIIVTEDKNGEIHFFTQKN